jgi:hypothetical protein
MPSLAELRGLVGTEGVNIAGRITYVGERKSGEGDYGEWAMQKLMLEDASGELEVQLKNREEVLGQEAVGKVLLAESVMQQRLGKRTGVKVQDYEFEGRNGPVRGTKAVITGSARLTLVPHGSPLPEWATAGASTTATSTGQPAGVRTTSRQPVSLEDVQTQMASLLDWASLQAARESLAGLQLTSQDWQGIVSTMFIQLMGRRG